MCFNIFAQDKTVMRVGGMELMPYGYGNMQTQPHNPIDSTNTDFSNIYSSFKLWVSAETPNGDTLFSSPESYRPVEMYFDTTNVLGFPNVRFTTVAIFTDTVANWRAYQYNVALNDHSAGILVYHLQYDGAEAQLNNVRAGVVFDVDAPNNNNHATSEDDILKHLGTSYRLTDSESNRGLLVSPAFNPVVRKHWLRDNSPRTIAEKVALMKNGGMGQPNTNGDFHFYIGEKALTVQQGESVVLTYYLEPAQSGLGKASAASLQNLMQGVANFKKDKTIAVSRVNNVLQTFGSSVPSEWQLQQNYPNPFNPETHIRFDVPASANGELITLTVYNIAGQRVREVLNRSLSAGSYEALWDGRDDSGNPVSSGMYIYRLSGERFSKSHKMLLVR